MNDRMLQQQIEQTGDLMDVLRNPSVLDELIQIEAECDEIGAGFPAYSYHPKPVTSEQAIAMRRTVRLQSIVFTELAQLIRSVNLGAGTDAAITEGRRRIRQHLANLTDEQQTYFNALVDEDQLQSDDKPIRAQLKAVLHSLLSETDWSAIGQAATQVIQTEWTHFIQRSKTA